MRWVWLFLLATGCGVEPPAEEPTPTPEEALRLDLPEPWAWCPGGADSAADTALRAGSDALYCGAFDEHRTFAQERAAKAYLRLVEGAAELPRTDGEHTVRVPACVELEDGEVGLVSDGDGVVELDTDFGGEGRWRWHLRQPLRDAAGSPWELVGWLVTPGERAVSEGGFPLDGEHVGLATDAERTNFWQVCEGGCADFNEGLLFDSCRFDAVPADRHRVDFDGGWLELDLRIGADLFLTQPALFVGARGELDGVIFEQRDYRDLLYVPMHHHLSRDFVVLSDDLPVCGLRVENLDPSGSPPAAWLGLVDCDLQTLEEREVILEGWEDGLR